MIKREPFSRMFQLHHQQYSFLYLKKKEHHYPFYIGGMIFPASRYITWAFRCSVIQKTSLFDGFFSVAERIFRRLKFFIFHGCFTSKFLSFKYHSIIKPRIINTGSVIKVRRRENFKPRKPISKVIIGILIVEKAPK